MKGRKPAAKTPRSRRGPSPYHAAADADEMRRMLAALGPLPDDPAFRVNLFGIEQNLRWIDEEERRVVHDPGYPYVIRHWWATANSCYREILRMLAEEQKRAAGATRRKSATRIRARIAGMVKDLIARDVPRGEWVDFIAPRLKGPNKRSDRQIRNVLAELGYPGEERK